MPDPAVSAAVVAVLEEAQSQGLIGFGPLLPHVPHSLGFASAVEEVRGRPLGTADRLADLGSGSGLPGLVLAEATPGLHLSLVEGSSRRAAFLRRAIDRLGLGDRVSVVADRAEVAGHEPGLRGAHSVVVARLFGPPGPTAECAAGLLEPGGLLVVSEPPEHVESRWSRSGLAELGMEPVSMVEGTSGRFVVLRQVLPCPSRYPRRTGVPAKRPLF